MLEVVVSIVGALIVAGICGLLAFLWKVTGALAENTLALKNLTRWVEKLDATQDAHALDIATLKARKTTDKVK